MTKSKAKKRAVAAPLAGFSIPITQAELKRILAYDEESGIFVWKVGRQGTGGAGSFAGTLRPTDCYIAISIGYTTYTAHRLAWLYVYGSFPIGQIDHINHIRNDNRIINLRDVPAKSNYLNRTRQSNNTSGCNGVSWFKPTKRWTAKIGVRGKSIRLGYFTKKEDAIKSRKEAEIKYGFHDNHGQKKPGD